MKSIEDILKKIEEEKQNKLLREKQEQEALLKLQNQQRKEHFDRLKVYENSILNTSSANSSSSGAVYTQIPDEFYIACSADSSNLFYIIDGKFRQIDLKDYIQSNVTINNTNEILRNGNDFYLIGNFGNVSTFFIKLTNCRLKNGQYFHFDKIEYRNINSLIQYIHGSCYYKGNVYMASRETSSPIVCKIDVNNLDNITTLVLPTFAGRRTTDVIAYKDNVYIMPSILGGTASIVRATLDLATYSIVLNTGTVSVPSRRVRTSSSFLLYNDEIYVPIVNNGSTNGVLIGTSQIGMEVYNLSGTLQRSVYGQTISTGGATLVPLVHWMTVFNNKLILSNALMGATTSHRSLVRMDINTLAIEESIPMDILVTDDNSIFSDGYMYLNGERSSISQNPPPPAVIKIKYNDFTDKTVVYEGYASYGSLNPTSYII